MSTTTDAAIVLQSHLVKQIALHALLEQEYTRWSTVCGYNLVKTSTQRLCAASWTAWFKSLAHDLDRIIVNGNTATDVTELCLMTNDKLREIKHVQATWEEQEAGIKVESVPPLQHAEEQPAMDIDQ